MHMPTAPTPHHAVHRVAELRGAAQTGGVEAQAEDGLRTRWITVAHEDGDKLRAGLDPQRRCVELGGEPARADGLRTSAHEPLLRDPERVAAAPAERLKTIEQPLGEMGVRGLACGLRHHRCQVLRKRVNASPGDVALDTRRGGDVVALNEPWIGLVHAGEHRDRVSKRKLANLGPSRSGQAHEPHAPQHIPRLDQLVEVLADPLVRALSGELAEEAKRVVVAGGR